MKSPDLQRSMYELSGNTVVQRITLATMIGLWLAFAWWLLLCGGLDTARNWFSWIRPSGNLVRRMSLAVAFSIYYVRILFIIFVSNVA